MTETVHRWVITAKSEYLDQIKETITTLKGKIKRAVQLNSDEVLLIIVCDEQTITELESKCSIMRYNSLNFTNMDI